MQESWPWKQDRGQDRTRSLAPAPYESGPFGSDSVEPHIERLPPRWCAVIIIGLSLAGWAIVIGAGWLIWRALGPFLP